MQVIIYLRIAWCLGEFIPYIVTGRWLIVVGWGVAFSWGSLFVLPVAFYEILHFHSSHFLIDCYYKLIKWLHILVSTELKISTPKT